MAARRPPERDSEVMLALSCDAHDEVDRMAEAAGAHGGRADVNPKQDLGVMYGRSFADPDDHVRETFYMDTPQMPDA